jgi:5-methylcytosine-specific restriction enzyme B
MNKEKTLKYLEEFAKEADQWFTADEQKVIFDNYDFLQTFFQKDYLEKLEWEDVQEMGRHLHAFHGNALAKQRAFGRPNHSIEHYRKVFNHLVSGDDDIITKLQDFYYNPDYTIDYFGPSAQSEIAGNIFPEQLIYNNLRDRKAAEFLGIDPGFVRGDNEAEKLLKFSRCLDELRSLYIEVVGQRTQMPLNIEIDQFFSYLYEKHIKNRAGVDLEIIQEEMLQLVNSTYPDWQGFKDQRFVDEEITYKKEIVRKAQPLLDEAELKRLFKNEQFDELFERCHFALER